MSIILSSQDASPFREIIGSDQVPILLVCDHASNRIPSRLGDLGGLSPVEMNRHIAWDIGAARVTELVAERLHCYAVLSGYSRLVVDCNRFPDDQEFVVEQSDSTIIPANLKLSEQEKQARQDEIFTPYQNAVAAAIKHLEKNNDKVSVISIHSFTPQLRSAPNARPWNMSVLWNKDTDTPLRMMTYFRKIPGMVVGDNEPYSMKTHSGYTLEYHAEGKRPSVLLEIRQDLVEGEQGCVTFADLIANFFKYANC